MNDAVLTHIDTQGVATVTFNNAEKHIAFDDQMIKDLLATFSSIAQNSAVRVLVLASTGKSFSAGDDLSWMKRMATYSYEENLKDANLLAQMLNALACMPQPIIARVQGAAFGGAVGLVCWCDIAVASRKAVFCLREIKIGLIPATIAPYVITAMGKKATRRYFTTAERFDADIAQDLGFVSAVVDDHALGETEDDFVRLLLANSPAAIRASKNLVLEVADKPLNDELIADTSRRIAEIRVSSEGQEGLIAFLEKRKPSWVNGVKV